MTTEDSPVSTSRKPVVVETVVVVDGNSDFAMSAGGIVLWVLLGLVLPLVLFCVCYFRRRRHQEKELGPVSHSHMPGEEPEDEGWLCCKRRHGGYDPSQGARAHDLRDLSIQGIGLTTYPVELNISGAEADAGSTVTAAYMEESLPEWAAFPWAVRTAPPDQMRSGWRRISVPSGR